jgi:hypothetical protein
LKVKMGDLLLHAHPGHTGMWCRNHLDRMWMFATFCAMRVRSFCMFGHHFVDADPASDSALEEQILWARDITYTRRYPLAWLVQPKYLG